MQKKTWLIILAIIVTGLVLRIWLYQVMDTHTTDGIAYLATAEFLRDSTGWSEIPSRMKVPFYPVLVYLSTFITRSQIDVAGRIVNLVIGTAMIPLIFLAGRKMFNTTTGLLASFLIAIDFVLIRQSVLCRADLLFSFLSILLIFTFWAIPWKKCCLQHSVLFGILLGITELTRSNGLFYLIIFLAFWLAWGFRKEYEWRFAITRIIIPVILYSFQCCPK